MGQHEVQHGSMSSGLDVRLLHDGTAAASAMAGEAHAAVITLGTALGVGFPPGAGSCRPLAPGFLVADAEDRRLLPFH